MYFKSDIGLYRWDLRKRYENRFCKMESDDNFAKSPFFYPVDEVKKEMDMAAVTIVSTNASVLFSAQSKNCWNVSIR